MDREEMNKLLGKSEEELDKIAEAFENDEVDLSSYTVVRRGRPTLFTVPMKTMTIREPEFIIKRVENRAKQMGCTKSAYIRDLIDRDLERV